MVKRNSYLLGCYEKGMPNKLSIYEKLQLAKKSGYDYMEISIDESEERMGRLYDETFIAKLQQDIISADFPILSMCLSGHRKYPLGSLDDEVIKKSLDIMERAIFLAYNTGIRIIQLAGYDVYYDESTDETKARFEENLKKATILAAKYGVILAFETMETPFMNTIEKAMKHVVNINSPYLQVYPDLGNITNACLTYNTKVSDDINFGEGHIVAAHLKETVPGIFRECDFGTGHVDFLSCIKQLYSQGVRMYVTEFWDLGSLTYEEDIKNNVKFFIEKFDQIEG